jgi:hypothetical protein
VSQGKAELSDIRPSFRFATSKDLSGIKRLWLEETEWGPFPFESGQKWEAAPGGVPRTLIAVNDLDNSVIGQVGFLPVTIKVGEELVRGVRPHTTIVSKAYRSSVNSLDVSEQPSTVMYDIGLRQLAGEGIRLAYSMPNPRWARLFRMRARTQQKSFPLLSFLLPAATLPELPEGWTVSEIETWGESIDDLCKRWSSQYTCASLRTADTLEWKAAISYHRSLAIYRRRELVGVVISEPKDVMWLVCDMLTADTSECLRATLIAAVLDGARRGHGSGDPSDEKKMVKVSLLATPLMEPVVQDLGFGRDDWNFPLVVERLDDSIVPEDVAPEKWYVSANE